MLNHLDVVHHLFHWGILTHNDASPFYWDSSDTWIPNFRKIDDDILT